jgi:hypothetical protein
MLALCIVTSVASAYSAEQSLGPWDMSRVLWYRNHPDETTARLKWCVQHNSGDSECGAAMQACNDILKTDPHTVGEHALRDLYPQVVRRWARAGVQLARCPT